MPLKAALVFLKRSLYPSPALRTVVIIFVCLKSAAHTLLVGISGTFLPGAGVFSFLDQVKEKGAYLRAQIEAMDLPCLGKTRGMGLMIGIELDRPCGDLVKLGLEAGLLINVTAEKVVRLLPSLNYSADDGRELVERLAALIRGFLSS